MERMLRDKKVLLIMLLPALIVFILFIPLPSISSFLLSFTKWDLISPIKFIGLENFRFMLVDDHVFSIAFKNTIVFVILSALFELPLAFLLANILTKKIKGRNFFRNIIFLPVTFSGVAVSLMFYFIYHPEVGLLNQFIRIFNPVFDFSWLADKRTALAAVVASLAWQYIGYHMVIYMAGISSISTDVIEASKIDGCSEFQMTLWIMFPLLRPVLEVSLVMQVINSLMSFDRIFIMTFGGPLHASEVLASHMYTKTFAQLRYSYGSSLSIVLTFLCIFITIAIKRLFKHQDIG